MRSKTDKKSPLHDQPLRYAGQSIDDAINKLFDNDITEALFLSTVFVIVTILTWISVLIGPFINPIIFTVATLIIVIYSSNKIIISRREIAKLKLGRDGEKIVAENLDKLKQEGDVVFHDIVGDKFNIDHVVLSKHGIFVIETKTRTKPSRGNPSISYDGTKILVNGFEPDRNAVDQVIALSKWLGNEIKASTGKTFPIRPVIVFPGWFVEPISSAVSVWVLNPIALLSFIQNEPINISDTDLCLLAYHLSRYIRTIHK